MNERVRVRETGRTVVAKHSLTLMRNTIARCERKRDGIKPILENFHGSAGGYSFCCPEFGNSAHISQQLLIRLSFTIGSADSAMIKMYIFGIVACRFKRSTISKPIGTVANQAKANCKVMIPTQRERKRFSLTEGPVPYDCEVRTVRSNSVETNMNESTFLILKNAVLSIYYVLLFLPTH